MPDNQPEPNYQDILDKYAASLKSTQEVKIPDTPEPEPEVMTDLKPETPTPILETPIESPLETPVINDTESVAEIPESLPPRENNFFKYLFFFSLFIFIIVFVSIVISIINSQKSRNSSNSTPTITSTPKEIPSNLCEINGESYQVNESFTATDGCNTCTCNEDLNITCTEKTCTNTPTKSATTSAIPKDWKTYTNDVYNFSFNYPFNQKISENIQSNFTQISIGNVIRINVQKNYPVNQPNYYLDSESNGERKIGNINWKTFYLKDGYSDGGIISNTPIYALQIEKDKTLYSISGFTSSNLTDQQLQIISTFKFL